MSKVLNSSSGPDKFVPKSGDMANASSGKLTGHMSGGASGVGSIGGKFLPGSGDVANATNGKVTGHGSGTSD